MVLAPQARTDIDRDRIDNTDQNGDNDALCTTATRTRCPA
jgi:hypothetical protein